MRRLLFQGTKSIKLIDSYDHPKREAEVFPSIVIQNGKDSWGHPVIEMGDRRAVHTSQAPH